ncbi:unnamed protein product [Blepharisma stoltei]|uniref:OTU domain-containing protein n=1 Tax=Blepharisma stoltei TaxID=1481888 RepID=A0AAU9JL41_9CILI|nr:unnamed protein product [Blepharisma stoltei]
MLEDKNSNSQIRGNDSSNLEEIKDSNQMRIDDAGSEESDCFSDYNDENPFIEALPKETIKSNIIAEDCLNIQPSRGIYPDQFTLVPMKDDGNCLYRSISYILSKSQEGHINIRNMIAEANEENYDNQVWIKLYRISV